MKHGVIWETAKEVRDDESEQFFGKCEQVV
jgi:hypothetical protein